MAAELDRVLAVVVMRTLLILMLAVGAACGKGCNDQKQEDAGYVLDHACKRAFSPTLAAFESAIKTRAPDECRNLDKKYEISVVNDKDDMRTVCAGGGTMAEIGDNQFLTGCFLKDPPLILIFERDERWMTDTAVHEWFHVLMYCTFHTPDLDHMQGALWIEYEKSRGLGTSAEAQARAGAEAGRCL